MKSHTEYLWFNTKKQREFINITEEVAGGADIAFHVGDTKELCYTWPAARPLGQAHTYEAMYAPPMLACQCARGEN